MTKLEERIWSLAMLASGVAALASYVLRHRLPDHSPIVPFASMACALIVAAWSWRRTALKRKAADSPP